jgi:hypothetical protein
MRWRINYYLKRIKDYFNPPKPLLTPEEHKEWIDKARRLEAIQEGVCKQLKCKPDEMLQRATKIIDHITEMNDTLTKAYVGMLIEKVHLDCKKHTGSVCKQCDKCLNNECNKCQAIDWLRSQHGMAPLLNTNKH